MRPFTLALLVAAALWPTGTVPAASLQNTDNVTHELIVTEPGYRQDFRHPYQLLEHSRTEMCFYGCELILRSTGQAVRIGPDDSVVISYGVLRVERSWRSTP